MSALLGGCGTEEQGRALADIDEARRQLATLAPDAREGLASDSIRLAREGLLEVESVVRQTRVWAFDDTPAWEPQLERALDNAQIASWVVERQRAAEREEAKVWMDSANTSLRQARGTGLDGVHFAVETSLRRSQVALNEAKRLFEAGEYKLASGKAREAADLASELPLETKALFARFGDPANLRRWRQWARAGIEESRRTGKSALVVDKRAQMAVLWAKGKPRRWFDVELGYNGLQRKLRSGDGATPEGLYRVLRKKGRGDTKYYKALLLDYPNAEDKRRFRDAKTNGEVHRSSSIGSLIEVHGDGGRGTNWTDGCVAVTNEEMDFLFEKLVVGSPVVIVGSYESIRDGGKGGNDGNE
jgi:L,D-peptidoglycan transpeptidase YkuD (ErfK/YbiS/YcfS/YnhG family)